MKLTKPVCSECRSDDVLADAYAAWEPAPQEWVVQNTFNKGAYCNKCDGETRLIDVELTGDELIEARAHSLALADGWYPFGRGFTAREYCDANDLDYEAKVT